MQIQTFDTPPRRRHGRVASIVADRICRKRWGVTGGIGGKQDDAGETRGDHGGSESP